MKNRIVRSIAVMCSALIICFASHAIAGAAGVKTVDRGAVWIVEETICLSSLTISKNAAIQAPEGCGLTLTVDGIGMPIKRGTYTGDVVLTVTRDVKKVETDMSDGIFTDAVGDDTGDAPEGGMKKESKPFRTAVYIENGKYVPEKSVSAAVIGGKVSDAFASDIRITTREGFFNGIMVTGDTPSSYTIINPEIDLSGNGGNDFTGLGAAISVTGKSDVTIDNALIHGSGYNRSAIFLGDEAVLHVNNSYIDVDSGILNEDPSVMGDLDKNMLIGPWLMGMFGKVRATNVLDNGTVYYNNCHIKSRQWGCLSTDGPKKIRLYATDCLIETVESGYGAYSIGDCHDYFSGCTFNVVDYGLILCDFADGTFTDGCEVNSKKIGVMMHDGSGGTVLTIDKGTVFNTRSTVIQIKGRRGADILVDRAELNSQSGIILQTMPNDDPNMSGWDYAGGAQTYSRDVNATFSNMALDGDIVNGFTASGAVNVTFKNAIVTGTITTAETVHPLGPKGEEITMETPELYYLIGEVDNVYCARPDDPHGISVALDATSNWIVPETSYLTGLSLSKGATLTAPKGYKLTMTVNGAVKKIKAGTYQGQIVLSVTKSS